MYAKGFRNLPISNDYSLEAIERDILLPSNIRFIRDKNGNIADTSSEKTGIEGSLGIETIPAENYTPEILEQALSLAERSEKEFIRTGKRELTINENPGMDNIDFERAVIISNLLDGRSLDLLSKRGMHGKASGNRMAKVDIVSNLLYKGSYGYDPYTTSPILGMSQDQGHLESNSRGGVRLRPELSLLNQLLNDTEGKKRLDRIQEIRTKLGAAKNFNEEVMQDPSINQFSQYKDFQKIVNKLPNRKKEYGYS